MNVFDRDYFKRKANPKSKGHKNTKCCDQDPDANILNKNNKEDWSHIEDHCENYLRDFTKSETIEPICCNVCGRLIEYKVTLGKKAWK